MRGKACEDRIDFGFSAAIQHMSCRPREYAAACISSASAKASGNFELISAASKRPLGTSWMGKLYKILTDDVIKVSHCVFYL